MARSGSEQRKASRRRQVGKGLALGTVALGVPALINAVIARRASRLPPAALPAAEQWQTQQWPLGSGHRLYVRTKGQGKSTPVLFLHSLGPGHSQQQWMEAASLTADQHPVILIDLLGWGESDRPDQDYDLASSVGELGEYIDQNCSGQLNVAASGEGAPLALSLAEELPAKIRSVALSGPAGLDLNNGESTTKEWAFDQLLGAPIFGTSAVNAYTRRSAIENSLLRHQIAAPSQAQLDEHYRLAHLPGSSRPLSAFLRGRYERSLDSLSLDPNLAVWIGWGRQAVGEPVEDADLWLHHLSEAELVVFEQAASWPHVDVPEQFATELMRFLGALS